jgi:hypothetical protein
MDLPLIPIPLSHTQTLPQINQQILSGQKQILNSFPRTFLALPLAIGWYPNKKEKTSIGRCIMC